MSAINGFHIGRGALRALSHAQGQLSCHHRQMLLFFGLDILGRAAADPEAAQLKSACPEAFATFDRLKPYRDDGVRRGAMFSWDLEAALGDTLSGLKEIGAWCREQTLSPDDQGDFRRLQMLTEAAAAYLQMAQNIVQTTGEAAPLRQASKIDPRISAAFIAEYMLMVSDRLEEKAARGGGIYGAFSERLLELRSRIKNNIPDQDAPLYALGERKISALYNIMSLMSEVGDLARSILDSARRLGDRDDHLRQGLEYLFHTAAVYDWQQFETAPPQKPAPANNVFRLRP